MQKTDKTIHCEYCQSFWKRKSDFTNHCKTAKHLKNKSAFLQQVENDEFTKPVAIPSSVTEIHAIISEIITEIEKMPCPEKVEEIPPPAPFELRFLEENAPDEKNMKPFHAVIVDIPVNMDVSINQAVTIMEDKHDGFSSFIEYIRTQIIRIITGSFFTHLTI
jgi:hypothetical protein